MVRVDRPTIFEFAGGEPAFQALARAHHERCLADPILAHPFLHPGHPEHVQRLGYYWAEVFGGPARFSEVAGGHSAMIGIHAGQGADHDIHLRFRDAFLQAVDDAGLPADPALRAQLRAYIDWAVAEVESYAPADSTVAPNLPTPRWGWNGLE